MESLYIYGTHAVKDAVRKRPDAVSVVYADDRHLGDAAFVAAVRRAGELKPFDERALSKQLPEGAVHQGLVALLDAGKLLVPFKTFKGSFAPTPETMLVVLGEIQDPYNAGAIIRSAAAFGAAAVLIPEHRQAPLTGTVMKASAGAAFSLPLVSVPNVNSALRDLKDAGCWVYGLDAEGDTALPDESFPKPTVLVVGNEGTGMRQKTREQCDTILTIPMHPRVESLNASVSAAVALYSWSIHHNKSQS